MRSGFSRKSGSIDLQRAVVGVVDYFTEILFTSTTDVDCYELGIREMFGTYNMIVRDFAVLPLTCVRGFVHSCIGVSLKTSMEERM